MLQLHQKPRSVSDYAIDFRTLSGTKKALFDCFLNRFLDSFKNDLAARELPSDLQDLIDLATSNDAHKRSQQEKCWPFNKPLWSFLSHSLNPCI